MVSNFQRFKIMPIQMIKNQFLLGQKLLAIIILSSLFSLTTLSQEKKLTKEIEETDNITINKDYWKTFESPNDKNKTKNYVGGNTLIEIGQAYVNNKKIFLLNPIPEVSYRAEIEAIDPIILNGDLSAIS